MINTWKNKENLNDMEEILVQNKSQGIILLNKIVNQNEYYFYHAVYVLSSLY